LVQFLGSGMVGEVRRGTGPSWEAIGIEAEKTIVTDCKNRTSGCRDGVQKSLAHHSAQGRWTSTAAYYIHLQTEDLRRESEAVPSFAERISSTFRRLQRAAGDALDSAASQVVDALGTCDGASGRTRTGDHCFTNEAGEGREAAGDREQAGTSGSLARACEERGEWPGLW